MTNNTSIHASGSDNAATTFNVIRDCLIVTLQADITDEYLLTLARDTAEALRCGTFEAMIMDAHSLELFDVADFERIRRIIDVAKLMGTKTILAGLRPGVAASLVELGIDTSDLNTSLNLECALLQLENARSGNNA